MLVMCSKSLIMGTAYEQLTRLQPMTLLLDLMQSARSRFESTARNKESFSWSILQDQKEQQIARVTTGREGWKVLKLTKVFWH
jgi:hypothetical protein